MTKYADAAELRARMVDRLLADDLAGWAAQVAPWLPALATVPRHEFIPDTVWIKNPRHWPTLLPLHRDDDPARWLELSYGADAVITQVDDGHPEGPGLAGAMQTSSASAPDIVAVMLAALDVHPGHRVLEVGTGTGYNAALLAHRLGAEHITSIEIDSSVAAQARTALFRAGYGDICVVTGDGALGYAPRAPYDRVIATAAVHSIPYPWVAQTRPSGRILLPWANSYTGALVALTVDEHGTARGGIVGESSFMWLRPQRERRGPVGDVVGDDEDRAAVHLTQLHPHSVVGDHGARFAIGQRVPRCQWRYWPYDEQTGAGVLWLLDFRSRSWAKLTHITPDASDHEFRVHQDGPRRLWDEVHAAHQWWIDHGKPEPARWCVTVSPHTQHIDLASL
ncbi:MAG: methyltransferase domain-containing protein [Pseudonocardiales bacterium]|nr:methyltransferase domain-containing protein [Pseudonocardiales bacterium]